MLRTAKIATLGCALLCCAPGVVAQPIGDFGRPRYSPFVDEFLPWLNDEVGLLTGRAVPAPYTDDEQTLHQLAYAILIPPEFEGPSRLTFAGFDFVEWWNRWIVGPRPYGVQSYADYLIAKPYRSSTARYARLIDDIRADAGRVPLFFSMANRVLESDAVRQRSFQFVALPAGKYGLARARVIDNRLLMDQVYVSFRQRLASYRYALECLLVLTPSPMAVEAERALFVLEDRLKRMTLPVPVAIGGVVSK